MSGGLHGSAALIGPAATIAFLGVVWLLLHIGNRRTNEKGR